MTVRTVSRFEKDSAKAYDAINQLATGRTNATVIVTLSSGAGVTTTVVSSTTTSTTAPNPVTCAAGSAVWLSAMTLNAAAALSSAYVPSTDISKTKFIIHHSTSTSTDRTFACLIMG